MTSIVARGVRSIPDHSFTCRAPVHDSHVRVRERSGVKQCNIASELLRRAASRPQGHIRRYSLPPSRCLINSKPLFFFHSSRETCPRGELWWLLSHYVVPEAPPSFVIVPRPDARAAAPDVYHLRVASTRRHHPPAGIPNRKRPHRARMRVDDRLAAVTPLPQTQASARGAGHHAGRRDGRREGLNLAGSGADNELDVRRGRQVSGSGDSSAQIDSVSVTPIRIGVEKMIWGRGKGCASGRMISSSCLSGAERF